MAAPPPPKKVLITGASGYVGQHLIASLGLGGISPSLGGKPVCDDDEGSGRRLQQYELFCAYNSLPTFEDDLNKLFGLASPSPSLHSSIAGITPISNIDFSSPDYLNVIQEACGERVDAIIHLAALSSPGYCESNASVAWKVNCPMELLKLNAPIIYMSTDQVYEGTKQFYEEDDATLPVNVYGRTKLAFERVLLRANKEDGAVDGPLLTESELGSSGPCEQYMPDIRSVSSTPNSVILRSSLILGPPTHLEHGCKKGQFPSFLQFIESRLRAVTPTDYFVNEFRSVVHVEDVIRALRHFLDQALFGSDGDSPASRVYNLGGSTRASRHDMASEVASHLKLDASSANAVIRPASGGGVPSPPDISMNVSKITKELNKRAMDGLKEIVAATYK